MVSLPDTVRKTAAIDEDWLGAEQVVEPSSTVILLFTLLLCAMELTRTFLLWYAERKRRQNVRSLGVCAAVAEADVQADFPLGELTRHSAGRPRATYKALADTLPSVKPESTSV